MRTTMFSFIHFIGLSIFCGILIAQTSQPLGIPVSNGPKESGINVPLFEAIGFGEGGVNLFTGDVSFDLDIDLLKLHYNGNVYSILAAPNSKKQTSWVGAGWTLTMGYITAQQFGTVNVNDDKFYFVSENGFSSEIKKIGTGYYLKEYKNWKIDPQFDVATKELIIGWKIIREDGAIYKYGDFEEGVYPSSSIHNSTRYKAAWGDYIGSGAEVDASLKYVPYQWDLRTVEDPSSWNIKVYYDRHDILMYNIPYTQESYLQKIEQRSGREIHFIINPRDAREYENPYTHDNYQKQYETKYLDEIQIKNSKHNIVLRYDFVSRCEEAGSLNEGRGKRFLYEIVQRNGAGTDNLPSHKFEYDLTNTEINIRGTLKKITYPTGGETEYKLQYGSENIYNNTETQINHKEIVSERKDVLVHSKVNHVCMNDEHYIFLTDSSEGVDLYNGHLLKFHAFHWDGVKWVDVSAGLPDTRYFYLASGSGDYYYDRFPEIQLVDDRLFIIQPKITQVQDPKLLIYKWTGTKWKKETERSIHYIAENSEQWLTATPVWAASNSYVVLFQEKVENSPSEDSELITFYYKDGDWYKSDYTISANVFNEVGDGYNYTGSQIFLDSGRLVFFENSEPPAKMLVSWRWNNNLHKWEDRKSLGIYPYSQVGRDITPQVILQDRWLIMLYTYSNTSLSGGLKVWEWKSNNWVLHTLPGASDYIYKEHTRPLIAYGNDKIVTVNLPQPNGNPFDSFPEDGQIHAWYYNGLSWVKNIPFPDSNNIKYCQASIPGLGSQLQTTIQLVDDKLIILEAPEEDSVSSYTPRRLRSWKFNKNNNWETAGATANSSIVVSDIHHYLKIAPDGAKTDILPAFIHSGMTKNYIFVLQMGAKSYIKPPEQPQEYIRMRIWKWEDDKNTTDTNLKWIEIQGIPPTGKNYGLQPTVRQAGNKIVILTGYCYGYRDHFYFRGKGGSVYSVINYNDEWNGLPASTQIHDLRVNEKKTDDKMGNTSTTTFIYEKGYYDTDMNSAKYNKVSVHYPSGYGITENHYYNDLGSAQTADPTKFINVSGFQELDGMAYHTESFNNSGVSVQKTVNRYSINTITHAPDTMVAHYDIYQKRIEETSLTLDGVTKTTAYGYNDRGQQNKITETNTDGATRIDTTTYAHEKYSGMAAANMLSQTCQQIVYQGSVAPQNAKTSLLTTYKDWKELWESNSKWQALATWQWKNTDNDGLEWDETDWADNTPDPGEWQLQNKINQRDNYGNVWESEDGKGQFTTYRFSHQGSFLAASAQNAKHDEIAYCNFEDEWTEYWDLGGGELKTEAAMSGKTSAFCANDIGPNKEIFYLSANKTYVAEAWVMPLSGKATLQIIRDYGSGQDQVTINSTGQNEWELIRLEYTPPFGGGTLTLHCGFPGAGNSGYVDDIRFKPKDGLVVSQVAEPVNGNVTGISDENNVPANFEFDDFHRKTADMDHTRCMKTAYGYYYSRLGNSDVFQLGDPNFIENSSFPNGNYIKNWSFELKDKGWTPYFDGVLSVKSQGILDSQYGNHILEVVVNSSDADRDGAHYDFYNGQNYSGSLRRPFDLEFEALEGQPVTFSAWVKTDGSSKDIQIGIENNADATFTVNGSWKQISVHFNSLQSALDIQSPSKRIRCYIVLSGTQTGTFYIDGVVLEHSTIDEPTQVVSSRAFLDGLGREIQTLRRDGIDAVMTMKTYNEMGKPKLEYHPNIVANANQIYMQYFKVWTKITEPGNWNSIYYDAENTLECSAAFNESHHSVVMRAAQSIRLLPGFSTTGVEQFMAKISESTWPSETFTYYNDPLTRLKTQTHPDDYQIQILYDSESFNNGPIYAYTQTIDESGLVAKAYADKFGNPKGSKIESGISLTSSFESDILGNVLRTNSPMHHAGNSGWQHTPHVYNKLGQIEKKYSVDAAEIEYCYDKNGLIRGSQDGVQRGQNSRFTAYQYDRFNRVMLIGEEKDISWASAKANPAGNYGADEDEWKVKNTYDVNQIDGAVNYCQGRITMTQLNHDTDNGEEMKILYIYDIYGNPIQKRVTIDGIEKTITAEYDKLGRETTVTYPSGKTFHKVYDGLGRVAKIWSTNPN